VYSRYFFKQFITPTFYFIVAVRNCTDLRLYKSGTVEDRKNLGCALIQTLMQLWNFSTIYPEESDFEFAQISFSIIHESYLGLSNLLALLYSGEANLVYCQKIHTVSSRVSFKNLYLPLNSSAWYVICIFLTFGFLLAQFPKFKFQFSSIFNRSQRFLLRVIQMFIDQSPNVPSFKFGLLYIGVIIISYVFRQYYTVNMMITHPPENLNSLTELLNADYKIIFPHRNKTSMSARVQYLQGNCKILENYVEEDFREKFPYSKICDFDYLESSDILSGLSNLTKKLALIVQFDPSVELNIKTELQKFPEVRPLTVTKPAYSHFLFFHAKNPLANVLVDAVKTFFQSGLVLFWKDFALFCHYFKYNRIDEHEQFLEKKPLPVNYLAISNIFLAYAFLVFCAKLVIFIEILNFKRLTGSQMLHFVKKWLRIAKNRLFKVE